MIINEIEGNSMKTKSIPSSFETILFKVCFMQKKNRWHIQALVALSFSAVSKKKEKLISQVIATFFIRIQSFFFWIIIRLQMKWFYFSFAKQKSHQTPKSPGKCFQTIESKRKLISMQQTIAHEHWSIFGAFIRHTFTDKMYLLALSRSLHPCYVTQAQRHL